MQSLDKYNKSKQEARKKLRETKHLAGVLCNECGHELHLSDSMILMSNPPKRNVHCTNCDFRGYKEA